MLKAVVVKDKAKADDRDRVALEDVEIKAHYSLQMSIEEVDRISRVSLKFVPEAELGAIIFPHL